MTGIKESREEANLRGAVSGRRQGGATMIEVLISLLVLAIGLLGVLGMQSEGSLANQRGLFTTQAALLAQDMADRMRVNDDPSTAADNGAYDGTDTEGNYTQGTCDEEDCNTAALVAHDRGQWKQQLEDLLPSGRGVVDWNDPVYIITVVWEERLGRGGAIGDDCGTVEVAEGFSCYRLEVRP